MIKGKNKLAPGAMAFIVLMGIVSLFSDMTHEGARSVLGEYLNLAGASAATIGFVSGFGELCGYSLRLLFGIAWFLGSWLLGVLYDSDVLYLTAVSVGAQLLAIVFYLLCIRKAAQEA